MWFHKDCVDMGSFTFLAYSTTNVSWICCRCNHSNFDRNLFHPFEIETTNNFDNLNSSGSENVVNSPNSDFAPTQHSSPIPPFRPKNRQRNWRTLLINCRSLKGEVANFLASLDWDNGVGNPEAANKSQCELLLSSLDTHALAQIHKEPTREENILDLLITNKPGLIKSSHSVPGISDQCAVVTELDIDQPYRRTKPCPVRQFKNANWEAIRQQIRSC